jgi:hypothetical protein
MSNKFSDATMAEVCLIAECVAKNNLESLKELFKHEKPRAETLDALKAALRIFEEERDSVKLSGSDSWPSRPKNLPPSDVVHKILMVKSARIKSGIEDED